MRRSWTGGHNDICPAERFAKDCSQKPASLLTAAISFTEAADKVLDRNPTALESEGQQARSPLRSPYPVHRISSPAPPQSDQGLLDPRDYLSEG